MRNKSLVTLVVLFLAITGLVFAQVATKSGSVYGKVVDDKGAALPGVTITLESVTIPTQTATSGAAGGFRFANLPPGVYSVNFQMEGFTEVRQEQVEVIIGRQVQLEITMKPSLAEEFTVIGETPVVDTKATGQQQNFTREYLNDVPSARDPWVIIDQTSGVDSDRYNVAGSDSGQQAAFFARGGTDDNSIWNYDGVDVTDPAALGGSPTYFDFDAFEELSISTAGNDASVKTGGVAVNIVTKRAGNKWAANASYYYTGKSLQSDNTPQEILDQLGPDAQGKSNHLDKVTDYGFDIGGPIIKDKLFTWGAYHLNHINLITAAGLPDKTKLEDINIKGNFNWNAANESQFGYFRGGKIKNGRLFTGVPTWQSTETLWDQGNSKNILNGIWTGQHTWIPNDHTIVTGRYGYIGNGFGLIPRGGKDVPMIVLGALPWYEGTGPWYTTDRPTHDITVDANYYKEKLLGGDHEFKFGFEYRTGTVSSLSTYGNGVYIYDYYQTSKDPNAPLTSGYIGAYHDINDKVKQPRQSLYVTDTYRMKRLTLNLGFRWDRQSGSNLATTVQAIPVAPFDQLGPIDFKGNDPGIAFNDYSPRIGATYDITGDGKTIIRGNFARYGDIWNLWQNWFNPTATFNGALYTYTNLNGDRVITPNEITSGPDVFGGATANGFDIPHFLSLTRIDPSFKNGHSNEYIVGFERQVMQDISFSVQYTRRNYPDTYGRFPDVPLDQLGNLYVQNGTRTFNTKLGSFTVPVYLLNPAIAQAVGENKVLETLTGVNQVYNGVDINVRKRMSHNFMLNTSLVLQRQKQDYSSLAGQAQLVGDTTLSGTPFPWNPGIVTFLNGQPYAYGPTSSGKSGSYPYSEWQLKISGVYQFPYEINVGAYARYQQGYPYVIWGSYTDPNGSQFAQTSTDRVLLEPFGSRRFDNMFSMDLQIEKGFKIQQYGKLTVSANLFNLFNANTVLRRSLSATTSSFNNIVENLSPRAVRLGIRYNF